LRSISSEERRTAAPLPPFPSPFYPSPSPYIAINTTCNLVLIVIGSIVRLFGIDLEYFNTMLMIVDLIMCE
jgi:hypothetical protein